MRWTIRRKLTAWIAVPLLVTYTLILLWDFDQQRDDTQGFMQQLAMDRASQFASLYSARLQGAEVAAQMLANAVERSPERALTQTNELNAPLRQNDWIAAVTLVWQAEGEPKPRALRKDRLPPGQLHVEPLADAAQMAESDWYKLAMAGQPGWILPRRASELGPGLLLSYSVPIVIKGEPHPRGAVAVHIPRSAFSMSAAHPRRGQAIVSSPLLPTTSPVMVDESAAETINSLQPSEYGVLGSGGEIIYRSAPETRGKSEGAVAGQLLMDAMRRAREAEGGVERVVGVGQELGAEQAGAYWVAFSPIAGTDWMFVSAVSEERVMAPLMREMAKRAGVLLLATVALGAMVYVVAVRMSRPIEQMAAAARQIGSGDLTARVDERHGKDEVAELGRVFNRMVRHIRSQMEKIRDEAAAREAVESELRVGRSIQADLLPRKFPPFPDRHEFALHGVNVPAKQVAGDFFDYFLTKQGKLMVVIADVSGKGVPAAILMAVTRTIVRNLAMSNLRPLDIVRGANAMLVEDSAPSMFVSLFLCEYDPATGELEYVNAGHPSPLSVRPDGDCRSFGDSTAPLLGVKHEWPGDCFYEARTRLDPGESLLLYTDGVTEARTVEGEFFGDGALRQTLIAHAADEPEKLCQAIVAQVENYQQGRQDDITVVVLKRKQ